VLESVYQKAPADDMTAARILLDRTLAQQAARTGARGYTTQR
jgi:hypothetical protein